MNATVQLLHFLVLANFPSGSSINYLEDKFYLLGDDARIILVLDKNYLAIDSVRIFDHFEKRIPKAEKADLEASAILSFNGDNYIAAVGSASTDKRKKLLLIPLAADGRIDHAKPWVTHGTNEFVNRLTGAGISQVNIEGASLKDGSLILANRGNSSAPTNLLIITHDNFWVHSNQARLDIVTIEQPKAEGFLGISEVCYVPSNNMLLFIFTSERTGNALDDGPIGDSYIAWVMNATAKLNPPAIKMEGMINLSDVSPQFKRQKIEGICLESAETDRLLLHLISDNDDGKSKLFKVLVNLNR
ncbi:MAG TPA: hypothetical protein VFZ52_12965 [Chryseolinea sp.]